MALFPNQALNLEGNIGKTHTGLVVSEGAAPAEKFIVSSTNSADPFVYEYGPEGNQTVVLAKGKIVEAVGEEKDRETGFMATAIQVAGEKSARAIGVNQHNVYDRRRGEMAGGTATVITRNYIEVPLFEAGDLKVASDTAKAMHFGAAYGVDKQLRSGDFVMAGVDGNFVKYDSSADDADFTQVIGQVLNVNRQMPPQGLLQYYTGLKSSQLENYLKSIGATPGAEDSIKPYGSPYSVGSWRPEFLKQIAGGNLDGIPFLTDGYFSAKERIEVTFTEDDKVEAVRPGDGVKIEGNNIVVADDIDESMVVVKLKHKLDPRDLDSVKVTHQTKAAVVGTGSDTDPEFPAEYAQLSVRDVHVDPGNNAVVLYVDGGQTLVDVTIDVASVVDPKAGIPTEWDYKGSVGAARILLLR